MITLDEVRIVVQEIMLATTLFGVTKERQKELLEKYEVLKKAVLEDLKAGMENSKKKYFNRRSVLGLKTETAMNEFVKLIENSKTKF
jgi:hypothetical protein